ncbi:hypothetical protein Glove_578g18 [Diversispora epigaea]|uniref:Uncharacterized protein n=1 Tax=Diversispora epigaea TaxID=1348612 RepID=A0A397G987_9GLOM|nr:hypothetical protein Glove_578g18 [Diversispora epigaea]
MAFQSITNNLGVEEKIILNENMNLFGMNSTTEQILHIFQETFIKLLNIKNDENGQLSYNKKPEKNLNSDDSILDVAKMYIEDFDLSEHEYLDVVTDQSIHYCLMKVRTQWPNLRPLLGQWHTSKDFCLVLIVLFSGYGLFNLARRLGVRFLDKLKSVVDYRATSRVLDLLIWKAHKIGIRIGNHDLQKNTLAAAASLFPSVEKANYTI